VLGGTFSFVYGTKFPVCDYDYDFRYELFTEKEITLHDLTALKCARILDECLQVL